MPLRRAIICSIAAAFLTTSQPAARAGDKEYCSAQLVPAVDIGHHLSEPGTRDVFGRVELLYNAELAHRLVMSFSELGFRRIVLINRTLNERGLRSGRNKHCAPELIFLYRYITTALLSQKKYTALQTRGKLVSTMKLADTRSTSRHKVRCGTFPRS